YEATTRYQHIHENPYRNHVLHIARWTVCQSHLCSRAIYVNSNCEVTDGTNVLTEIDVLVGTHLCIFNQSGCKLTVKWEDTLFGASSYEVPAEGCVNLTVQAGARGQSFISNFICVCAEGGGHSNPDVKVGDGEEPGG